MWRDTHRDDTKEREDTRQKRSGVCHVRCGDDSSVRLKVCWLFRAGKSLRDETALFVRARTPLLLRYVEEMSFPWEEGWEEVGRQGRFVKSGWEPAYACNIIIMRDNNRRLPWVP